ncbi:hypothetical protein [Pseudorhodoplanes sp.]|uniref:hypothetical protein n=1 Tax=Pseudorhodoplanes sp. TaxID=1934341 RepID=UPI002BB7F5F3|nr:hypothetical protein [Pseudorhodoplanes sp.]HWV52665.1 hypothetical protein [Pseudorhodoplanes sp.]
MKRALRWLKRLGIALAVIVVLCAIPIVWIETQCMGSLPREQQSYRAILPAEHRRNMVDTYLTYPEWSIVHAYEDFAGVARQRGESAFRYFDSIAGYWRSLCSLSAIASAKGEVTGEMKTMLYVIGISFTGEMGVKGAYEKTAGKLTEWIRRSKPTPEDLFAHKVNDDYAAFLRQTPWYEFPFGQTLARFWRDTSWSTPSFIRSIERRMALTMEYGVKAGYAWLIAQGAALSPAKLTIRSVIADGDPVPGADMKVVEQLSDGTSIVETPRYRAFTQILLALMERNRRIVEIAGNDEIFITVLTKDGEPFAPEGARALIAVPLQARPGFSRRGYSVRIAALPAFGQALRQAGGEFEHAYDY